MGMVNNMVFVFSYQGVTSAPEDEEALAIGFLVQILSLLVTRDLGNVAAVKVKEAVYFTLSD